MHTIPDSKRFIKNFHSRERIGMPDSPETCGRKPYPEIKIADLKISEEMQGVGLGLGLGGAQMCRHSVVQFELASSVITQNVS